MVMPSLEVDMNRKIKLALMHDGSDEEGLSAVLIKWASEVIAQRAEFEPCVIELADLVTSPGTVRLGRRHESLRYLAKADAYLIVTSEQSNSYPAELKAFIDRVPIRWHARPVAFIGYGGASGGLRAIDQLRQVLAGQHAVPICNFVSFPNPWALIDEREGARLRDHARLPMARMLVQLNWWAKALRTAREQSPYELVS